MLAGGRGGKGQCHLLRVDSSRRERSGLGIVIWGREMML